MKRFAARAALLFAAVFLVPGCAAAGGPGQTAAGGPGQAAGRIPVVAAENFWGSIAAQLGGTRVAVTSIITNPNTDPHEYEPTAADARTIAGARLVIENGIGYDPWAGKLLAANPVRGRLVVDVGDVVGVPDGGNPHRWYDPSDVEQVMTAVTSAYERLDPAAAGYFRLQQAHFEDVSLAAYHRLISEIRSRYRGTRVGVSESIFAPLASSLGLDLVTPPSFLQAISEGAEPTAADLALIGSQIKHHEIAVYVYNSQNATPDVRAQVAEARAAGIPVTTVTETLAPANLSFQAWQVQELRALQAALAKATAR